MNDIPHPPLSTAGAGDCHTTLVIVDMQERLRAANHKPTLVAVKKLLNLAMKCGWGIVFLEIKNQYEEYGPTIPELLHITRNHPRRFRLVKDEKDGSLQVAQAVEEGNLETGRFVLAGVNLDACVVFTANGLARLYTDSRIEVVCQACHSENPAMWDTWSAFVAHDTINLVSLSNG